MSPLFFPGISAAFRARKCLKSYILKSWVVNITETGVGITEISILPNEWYTFVRNQWYTFVRIIHTIIGALAKANDHVSVIDVADFNYDEKLRKGQEMVDRLTKLIAIFVKPVLDFSKNRAGGDDILGDAFEYLMKNFATESYNVTGLSH